jgi:predicted ABC-type transport system involved in lysophospholipase L1 biosynthesis ATPase subunit
VWEVIKKTASSERRAPAQEAWEGCALRERAGHMPGKLSGGEQEGITIVLRDGRLDCELPACDVDTPL